MARPADQQWITLAADASLMDVARERWLFPLLNCWPAEPAPEPRLVPLEDAMEAGGVVVLVGEGDEQLVEPALRLASLHRPTIALARDPKALQRELREGVLVESRHAAASHLASMAYALSRRQPTIDGLIADLGRATRSIGGLADEFTKWQDEMHMAASVQRDLLPKSLPKIEGLASGVLYRPCGFVSGDIYDVRVLSDGRVSFLLADAVGHGVPAALLTMVIAHALPTNGHLDDRSDPAEMLRRVNIALCERQTETTRFATAVAGVIDPASGRGVLAGAGHPAPLLIGDGSEALRTNGPLLGVFEEAEFDTIEFELAPGESLICYTDGFETAYPSAADARAGRVRSNSVHLERLAAITRAAREGTIDLADAMRELAFDVDAQAGSLHQPDDLTALAFMRPASTRAMLAA